MDPVNRRKLSVRGDGGCGGGAEEEEAEEEERRRRRTWVCFFAAMPSSLSSCIFFLFFFFFFFITAVEPTHSQQVHVTLAGPKQIRVSWISSTPTTPSRVEYGTLPGVYDRFGDGRIDSYSFLLYKSGYVHNVVIGPLAPNTVYFYRCGGNGNEYSFKMPPSEPPITFAVVGDLGQTQWTKSTLEHLQRSSHDLLILPGDLSYADYFQPLWDSFGTLIEPLASHRPWLVTQGNHEVEGIPGIVEPFKAYNTRWQMPFRESSSDSNLYYSFEISGVHVLMLGSYTNFSPQSNQYKWLLADLANVDRSRTPWLVGVIHAPWYSSNRAHFGDGEEMRKSMELVLKQANVDLIFAGHVHAYERMDRIFDWKLNDCGGIMHITIGDGGNREGLARTFMTPKPDWSVYREASFGYGMLQVVNSTHAHWAWHRNEDIETVVGDELWIQNQMDPAHPCNV